MAQIIAFVSGKGGTGKSSICAAMATTLAQTGSRVLCIDCVEGMPGLDIPLGMAAEGCISWREVCRGDYSARQGTCHPWFPAVRLLTAAVRGAETPLQSDLFGRMLQSAETDFDYILLDAPADMGPMFHLAVQQADCCIVVALPDPAAIRAARRVGEELECLEKGNVRLVVNRVNERMLKAMGLTIDDVVDQTGLQLLGLVPVDTDVLEAAAAGSALLRYSKKGAAAAINRICQRMQGNPVKIPVRSF